jgi:hypothetical protein
MSETDAGRGAGCNPDFSRETLNFEARELLRKAPGVGVQDERDDGGHVTPEDCARGASSVASLNIHTQDIRAHLSTRRQNWRDGANMPARRFRLPGMIRGQLCGSSRSHPPNTQLGNTLIPNLPLPRSADRLFTD